MRDTTDSDTGNGQPDDEARPQHRERNREASRRFRERKKEQERALAVENTKLKEEMETLRKRLASTSINVPAVMSDVNAAAKAAVENLKQSVPGALLPNLQRALSMPKYAAAMATQLIKDIKHTCPALAYSEIRVWGMLTWLDITAPGLPEPEDPLLKEIYHIWGKPGDKNRATPEQIAELRNFFSTHRERYKQLIDRRRRLRLLLQEAAVIAAEVEADDAWFTHTFEPFSLRTLRPEQVAGRVAWIDKFLPELQDRVVGSPPPANPTHSPEPSAPIPAPPPVQSPTPSTAAPSPPPPSARPRGSAPPAAPAPRKRTAEGPGPSVPAPAQPRGPAAAPAPAPAPPGAGVPPDVLRDLIREAVTRELSHFFQSPLQGMHSLDVPAAAPGGPLELPSQDPLPPHPPAIPTLDEALLFSPSFVPPLSPPHGQAFGLYPDSQLSTLAMGPPYPERQWG
eukprot:tig00021222_g19367.t1